MLSEHMNKTSKGSDPVVPFIYYKTEMDPAIIRIYKIRDHLFNKRGCRAGMVLFLSFYGSSPVSPRCQSTFLPGFQTAPVLQRFVEIIQSAGTCIWIFSFPFFVAALCQKQKHPPCCILLSISPTWNLVVAGQRDSQTDDQTHMKLDRGERETDADR